MQALYQYMLPSVFQFYCYVNGRATDVIDSITLTSLSDAVSPSPPSLFNDYIAQSLRGIWLAQTPQGSGVIQVINESWLLESSMCAGQFTN